ncbi:MAG: endonuclease/exonuclease/phosphatase family protein [Candidatus Eremiobacteraeota bacterium]|nr:endonuclease/exonuclease/phosphatase family protein [Candidatus Eremiobacteraeota bacterium]
MNLTPILSTRPNMSRTKVKPQAQSLQNVEPQSPEDAVSLSVSKGVSIPAASELAGAALHSATQVAEGAVGGPNGALLRVLSLNTYFDSRAGVDKMVDLIKTTKADLVGLQEVNLTTKELASKLGMHYLQQDKRTALLSRFPIEEVSNKKYGVNLTLKNGQKVSFLNAHTTSFPNQPHQLMHLPKGGGPYIDTEKQAVWWADITRGREFRDMAKEADALGGHPTVITGDFNEPSHLDWTQRVADAGRHPIKVEWPGSKTLAKAGFKDSYREFHPDPLSHPGNTWTPTTRPDDPKDHHDRIDFVMYRGEALKLVSSEVVGESREFADIVIDPYPTDHRAVLSTFEVAPPA